MQLVQNILQLRDQLPHVTAKERPLFIWEPVPDLCTPKELEDCFHALKCVDAVSPNHAELGAFCGVKTDAKDHVDYRAIEALCRQWLESGIGPDGKGAIVVRAGKDGCLIARRGFQKWLPAVHQSPQKVVDPTGGGNGFLGGLAMGLVCSGATSGLDNLEEAAIWGSVAASFAIEQVGMPSLSHTQIGDTWNGVRVEDRLIEFKERLHRYVQP